MNKDQQPDWSPKSLDELRAIDSRAQLFTPYGLAVNSPMLSPEGVVDYQQGIMAAHALGIEVSEETRKSFDRLRMLHVQASFCYDLYRLVEDMSWLVCEQGLRQRFVTFYSARMRLAREGEDDQVLDIPTFDAVDAALGFRGTHSKGWQLRLSDESAYWFRPTFSHLLNWARREGLLPGQRSRRFDQRWVDSRNDVAHPEGYVLHGPVESAFAIGRTAELINRLWGAATPGGRFFPAPIPAETTAVGWDDAAGRKMVLPARDLADIRLRGSWTFLILLASPLDEWLMQFDSLVEATVFPARYRWGPGPLQDALSYLEQSDLEAEEVDYLDRHFLVRQRPGACDFARSPEVAAAVEESQRDGTWWLIRADTPNDALLHVRGPGGIVNSRCSPENFCEACGVDVLGKGDWASMIALAGNPGPQREPHVHVPGSWAALELTTDRPIPGTDSQSPTA